MNLFDDEMPPERVSTRFISRDDLFGASSTDIICKIGPNSSLIPNTMYPIEVIVKNIGKVLYNLGKKLK